MSLLQVSRLEAACASKSPGTSIKSFLLGAKKKAPGFGTSPAAILDTDASPCTGETSVLENRNPEVTVKDSQECKLSHQGYNAGQSADAGHLPSGSHASTSAPNKTSSSEAKSIDMEVLLALPEDIRDQVIAEYQQQGYIIPTLPGGRESDSTCRGTSEPQPSTSGYVVPEERKRQDIHINEPQPAVTGAEASRKTAGGDGSELKGDEILANKQGSAPDAAVARESGGIQDVMETSNSNSNFSTVTENAQDSTLITSFSQVSTSIVQLLFLRCRLVQQCYVHSCMQLVTCNTYLLNVGPD